MRSVVVATALAFGAHSVYAQALTYQQVAAIPWAPVNATSIDQGAVYNGTYYLADRTNKGVHVVDLSTLKQTGLLQGGFQGLVTDATGKANTSVSGPDGILVLPDLNELYIGDASASIKVYDLKSGAFLSNISAGNTQHRADEMAYDPDTGTVICAIPNDDPPRLVVIAAKTRTVTGEIPFVNASGIEQPVYNPTDKNFYVSIPDTETYPGGAIAVVNATALQITKYIPLHQCNPAGIAFASGNQNLFVGCSQDQILNFNVSYSVVLDVTTGKVVANISGVSGVDQVTYSSSVGHYYAAAYQNMAGGLSTGALTPQLVIVDAKTNTVFQTIPTDNLSHSVAVDETHSYAVVPLKSQGIVVYGLKNGTTGSNSTAQSSGVDVGSFAFPNIFYIGLAAVAGILLV